MHGLVCQQPTTRWLTLWKADPLFPVEGQHWHYARSCRCRYKFCPNFRKFLLWGIPEISSSKYSGSFLIFLILFCLFSQVFFRSSWIARKMSQQPFGHCLGIPRKPKRLWKLERQQEGINFIWHAAPFVGWGCEREGWVRVEASEGKNRLGNCLCWILPVLWAFLYYYFLTTLKPMVIA